MCTTHDKEFVYLSPRLIVPKYEISQKNTELHLLTMWMLLPLSLVVAEMSLLAVNAARILIHWIYKSALHSEVRVFVI